MSAKIATALHEVMSKVGYVQKTGKNAFHGYKYAGEADLLDKLRPAMVEAGLMLLPSVKFVSPVDEHGNVIVNMEYTLVHKDGDIWPEPLGAAGMGNDRAKNGSVGDKGVYKAITGANKYLLFKLFQIETGDDPETADHAHEAPPVKSSAQLKREGVYPEFEREVNECANLIQLEKLASAWREKASKDGWNSTFKMAAKDELDRRREELQKATDDDTFPGDLPSSPDLKNNAYASAFRAG